MPELTITAPGQQARISTVGGRIVQYAVGGREVLAGRDGPDREYRSALLAPWPNRLTAGRWSFAGEDHLIKPGEVEGTVMHGLVAYALFDVVSQSTGHVTLQHHLEPQSGYPFPLRVDAEYTLTMRGLDCVLRVTNAGNDDAPVALGVHPYLETRGRVDDVMLRMPASTLLRADEQWNETGRAAVHGTGFDFRTPRAIGAHQLDHTFTDLEQDATGRVAASVVLPGGDEVTLWAGGSCHWLVVYTADTLVGPSRRSSLAIEPYTAPANALRTGTDLQVLAKGEHFELTWGLEPSWLAGSERPLDTTRGESR